MPTQLIGQGQGGTCAYCGAPLEADAAFCIVCGRQVVQGGAATGFPVAPPTPAGSCANCGAPLEAGAQFCVVCGAEAAAGAGRSPMGNQGAMAIAPSCPNCGWPLEPDAIYCISCGIKLDTLGAAHAGGSPMPGGRDSGAAPFNAAWAGNQTINLGANGGAQQWGNGRATAAPHGPITPIPAPITVDNDDDASVRPQLIMLTPDEARRGCIKRIEVNRQTHETIEVNIPAGVNVTTKLDVQGYGNPDGMTGRRGPLRLSFFID